MIVPIANGLNANPLRGVHSTRQQVFGLDVIVMTKEKFTIGIAQCEAGRGAWRGSKGKKRESRVADIVSSLHPNAWGGRYENTFRNKDESAEQSFSVCQCNRAPSP